MRLLFFFICCIVLCSVTLAQKRLTYDANDIAALKGLTDNWQKYWNTHNMDSMGNLLTEDVDFINVAGIWLKGKTAAINDHKEKHEGVKFKTSVWNTDSVHIKYVKPDLAILHIGWGISNDFEDDGTPRLPRHGIFTWVATKQNNKWLLLTVHNTNIKL